MAISYELEAQVRHDKGKGASRRLRRADQVPAVIYGADKEATALLLEHNKVLVALQNEAFYTRILTLKIDGQAEKVILKDLQRHAFKPRIMHMDFLRISAHEKLKMHIPLHFKGGETAPGVLEGGLVSHLESDVEVSCLPANLPEFIEVDISNLALDQLLHISDLQLPEGVEAVALSHDNNLPIVTIHMPRAEVEEAPVVAAVEGAEGAAVSPAEVPATAQKAPVEEKKDEK